MAFEYLYLQVKPPLPPPLPPLPPLHPWSSTCSVPRLPPPPRFSGTFLSGSVAWHSFRKTFSTSLWSRKLPALRYGLGAFGLGCLSLTVASGLKTSASWSFFPRFSSGVPSACVQSVPRNVSSGLRVQRLSYLFPGRSLASGSWSEGTFLNPLTPLGNVYREPVEADLAECTQSDFFLLVASTSSSSPSSSSSFASAFKNKACSSFFWSDALLSVVPCRQVDRSLVGQVVREKERSAYSPFTKPLNPFVVEAAAESQIVGAQVIQGVIYPQVYQVGPSSSRLPVCVSQHRHSIVAEDTYSLFKKPTWRGLGKWLWNYRRLMQLLFQLRFLLYLLARLKTLAKWGLRIKVVALIIKHFELIKKHLDKLKVIGQAFLRWRLMRKFLAQVRKILKKYLRWNILWNLLKRLFRK